ncbi:Rz1-like lysis system protein LysC [Pelagerythrobacter marinus]|uniref:Rz1-like lysis system protein LysC n=1 Tax=Pelagerythrobacter marinus TaxID=538382 RepID=UPI002AC96E92|nr:Rz1-like lysis system protein LysC [Pelagerythrobacter marinus]WPZ05678.1 Rz1-like lysis system protein LysC [Pelagerythrobacter marinus]
MPKSKSCWAAGCLLILGACSNRGDVESAPREAYRGIPAGLMAPCVVVDIALDTVGDLVASRELYKAGFEACAAKVDAIRKHDAEARATTADD